MDTPSSGPVRMAHDVLVALLTDVLARVKAGDSFEGSFSYASTVPGAMTAGPVMFEVTASYRIGELNGQGGPRVVG